MAVGAHPSRAGPVGLFPRRVPVPPGLPRHAPLSGAVRGERGARAVRADDHRCPRGPEPSATAARTRARRDGRPTATGGGASRLINSSPATPGNGRQRPPAPHPNRELTLVVISHLTLMIALFAPTHGVFELL